MGMALQRVRDWKGDPRSWQEWVVVADKINIRKKRDGTSKIVGRRVKGDTINVDESLGTSDWLKLALDSEPSLGLGEDEGFVMVEHKEFGQLVEQVPIVDKAISLAIMHPEHPKRHVCDVRCRSLTTIGEVRDLVERECGLGARYMICNRGKAGAFIDGSEHVMRDDWTCHHAGLWDGDQLPFLYMGRPDKDLDAFKEKKAQYEIEAAKVAAVLAAAAARDAEDAELEAGAGGAFDASAEPTMA